MTATKRYRPTKESIYVLCRVMICVIAFAAFAALQTEPAAAAATNYNVWVGGTQVTSANCSSSKTWTYAPATRTLTLNNYTYSGTGKKVTFDSEEELYANGGICAKQDLNLVINGTNKVTGTYLNDETINAARDLGANNFQTLVHIWFPLSIPGIISGITMVFVPALTTFVISNLLGGSKIMLIGNIIDQEFTKGSNWNLGSGLSLVLMIFILLSMALVNRYDKDGEGGAF